MAQTGLYYHTQLESKVSIAPHELDADLDEHILRNLKMKVENKCNEHGIIIRVTRLINYQYGMIDKTNLTGTTIYKVEYECLICSPRKDVDITGSIENILAGYIVAQNGPVVITVSINNVESQKFEIKDGNLYYTKTKKQLEKGDFIKVSVINNSNNLGEKRITTTCKLLDLASKDDIAKYHEEQKLIHGNNTTDDEFI